METNYPYQEILADRIHALEQVLESMPGEIHPGRRYGEDLFQEEFRSMGLRLIRDGLDREGESLILAYTEKHYPENIQEERLWIPKMVRYPNAITDILLDNLHAEGYVGLQANTIPFYENALLYPVKSVEETEAFLLTLPICTIIPLSEVVGNFKQLGLLYFKSGSPSINLANGGSIQVAE